MGRTHLSHLLFSTKDFISTLRRGDIISVLSFPHDHHESNVTDPIKLIDSEVSFDQDRTTNDLIIKNTQYIPDSFLSDLRADKMDSLHRPCGEMLLALSVPVEVIDEMKRRYGFDAMEAPIAEVRKFLQRLHMDDFIATNKRI